MSRRSRKRKVAGEGGGWGGRVVIGLLVLLTLVFGGGYLMLRSYLHSDGFRLFLSREVSRAGKVRGEFSPFRWDGLATDSAKFLAEGDGPLVAVRADGLHTEVGFDGVRRGVWELKGTSITRLEIGLDASRQPEISGPPEVKIPVTKKERPRKWYPSEVEVTGIDIGELVVRAITKNGGLFSASKMAVKLEAEKTKDSYRAEIRGGQVQLPGNFLPDIFLDRMKARYQAGNLFVTSAKAAVWDGGEVNFSGEWDTKAKTYAFEGTAADIPVGELLSESWAKRVTGVASSTFTVDALRGNPHAHGTLIVDRAVLTALPVLEALAAYADTRRFRELNLNEARLDWEWSNGEITLTKIVLASDGLVRIEGNLAIRDGLLDGNFRLGLAPGTLAAIPGAESDVFTPGEKGLLWTPLRITGSKDDPKEDLTDRLIAAAGLRMFDEIPGGAGKVLKFSRSVLGDSPEEAILRGTEVIEQTEDVVREARDLLRENKGLLDGIFGGSKSREERKKER